MRTSCWILRFARNDRLRKLLFAVGLLCLYSGCAFLSSLVEPPKPPPRVPPAPLPEGALLPSPRLIVGRIVALDAERRFAFVELAPDAPAGAAAEGTELIARTLDLRETARLQVSRHVRGRTLGTRIVSGQPAAGDEVVWLAP